MSHPLANRYVIQAQLGRQTGRETLLAQDLQTNELVVIKRLLLGDEFEWQDLKLFEREATVLKTLSHPQIPRYLDYLEFDSADEGKGFAIVQSYVEARSLEQHLRAGRTFSESEVKQLARSLLEILMYLHEHQPPVIHRDLKPSNILLANRSGDRPGEVYLVDFGSVQSLAVSESSTITVVGTYGYMPPEQFGGRVTPASDLYSLGATLIFLATGRHPTELPQRNFQIQFRQAANLSPAFADWLEWLTEPGLDRRLSSATEALQSLNAAKRRPPNAIAVPQPVGSDVQRTKTATALEILSPRKDISYRSLAAIALVIPVAWWLFGSGCFFSPTILLNLGALVPSGAIALGIAFLRLRQVWLHVDDRDIILANVLFGWKWRQSTASRQMITRLVLQRYQDQNRQGDVFWRVARLRIWAGSKQVFDLETDLFTEAELCWLAAELSHWLAIPIDDDGG
ncbi:serine/threonine protein kinase [Leptolyngbya sp. FACHB-36]|uniref:serine/threonine protein kinase n=1 Tax=Leptolyngbya sp. FACHB-36 TaxID=2692808 RepID=UPI0016811AD7|nr:serine/threonine-protein kinase [Leptolyngbya sp. FACHB-36]MBD2022222.1 serine/threonine protein kinase [Leptolyngbya sp. FACHB-36]